MRIRKVTKPVWVTSDGSHFGDEDQAKAHEFGQWYKDRPIKGCDNEPVDETIVRSWLKFHKNDILRQLGTTFDPEAEESK